jgi:chromosome segregation ATPase
VKNFTKLEIRYKEKIDEARKKYNESKEKLKKRTKNLHSILKTCEKIIEYFYHSCRVFIKTLGKVLYNLVFKIDFNFKGIVNDLIKYDNKEMYDYVHHLEKNEFLKKNKMLRKMHEKVHFYEKLELPKYQKAYTKIANSLKDTENMGQRGELSYLNENSMYMGNTLNMSRNRSLLTRGQFSMNDSINQDQSQFNLLDGLDSQIINTSMVQRPQNLLDMMQRITEKLKVDKFSDLNFVSTELFVKKLKEFIEHFEENIVTLNIDPKNRNEHNKLKEIRAEQNNEFYSFCLDEFKQKMNFCDNRLKIIELIIKNREIKLEEREQVKLYQILTDNKAMIEEDKLNNDEEIDKIELLKLVEESFQKKKNILADKRNFMSHIENIVEQAKKDLDDVFNKLNMYEDKYMLSIAKHKENKKKIELNKLQLQDVKSDNVRISKEMREQNKELEGLDKQLKKVEGEKDQLRKKQEDFDNQKQAIQSKIKTQQDEVVKLTEDNIRLEVYIIELEETNSYIGDLLKEKKLKLKSIQKEKDKEEKIFKKKLEEVNQVFIYVNQ